MDEIEEHIIIHTNRKIKSKVRGAVLAVLILPLCYKLFGGQVGLIVGFIVLFIGNHLLRFKRYTTVWKMAEDDYKHLLSIGYSDQDALKVVSRSFNPDLSGEFHRRVVQKFPAIEEVIVFHTGALRQGETDESSAIKCLGHTSIEKTARGYKPRTSWE
jgi:hypothetical protein